MVEDDFDLSRLVRDVLRESQHEVVSYVRPSVDVLEHLKTYRPDLIILDARLNSTVTGWDIIESLKADPETASIPVIVCSGAAKEIDEHRNLLESYGVPVLPKPFDIDALDSLVSTMLVA
jgi:DNA-binding response OmpR family regulator